MTSEKLMNKAHFGMIGFGTMGRNFLLNVAEHGFSCVGFDVDAGKRKLLDSEAKEFSVETAKNLKSFVAAVKRPRKIMMLVPAGKIVDSVIEELLPNLDKGDIIIDGANSHFTDTERREKYLNEKGFGFLGVGVSGGEEGARHGASIMPGGKKSAYNKVAPILEAASAKVGGIEPCVAYMGKGSAGHFVKMVHNGIEYGLMEILAETYDFMWRVLKMDYAQMSKTFAEHADLPNLILDYKFAETLNKNREDWRTIVDRFTHGSVPVMCLSMSLAYFDAFRSEVLPANLIQSQRDFFGAHTYQQTDQKGIFHTPDWNG